MNQTAVHPSPNTDCADMATAAQRELKAFFTAVTDLFGREQAELSADDWLNELAATEVPPASVREWRDITVRASAQLAARVYASSGASCGAFASACS